MGRHSERITKHIKGEEPMTMAEPSGSITNLSRMRGTKCTMTIGALLEPSYFFIQGQELLMEFKCLNLICSI